MKRDGSDQLMVTLQRRVFPTLSAEARELLERGGSLSELRNWKADDELHLAPGPLEAC